MATTINTSFPPNRSHYPSFLNEQQSTTIPMQGPLPPIEIDTHRPQKSTTMQIPFNVYHLPFEEKFRFLYTKVHELEENNAKLEQKVEELTTRLNSFSQKTLSSSHTNHPSRFQHHHPYSRDVEFSQPLPPNCGCSKKLYFQNQQGTNANAQPYFQPQLPAILSNPDSRLHNSLRASYSTSTSLPDRNQFVSKTAAKNQLRLAMKDAFNDEDFAKACNLATEMIQLEPCEEGYTNQSEAFRLLKQFPNSLSAANQALAINENNIIALVSKGIALQHFNHQEDSLAIFEKVLSMRSTNEFALRGKIKSLLSLNRLDECSETVNFAIKYGPHDDELESLVNQLSDGSYKIGHITI